MLNITTWYKQKFICQWNQENLLHLVRVWDQVLISVIQIITIIVMIDSATSSVVSAVFSSVYNMSSSVPSRAFKWFHDDIGVQFFPHIIDQLCKYYLPLWRFWYHSTTTPPLGFSICFIGRLRPTSNGWSIEVMPPCDDHNIGFMVLF